MSNQIIDRLAGAFRDEARERLAELESALLELESHPDDLELVARAFRALHTLKGNGRMFGFDEVSTFAHEIETVFDHVRKGRLPASHELIGLTLNSLDLIALMVQGQATDPELRDRLITAFRKMQPAEEAPPVAAAPAAPPAMPEPPPSPAASPEAVSAPLRSYRIRFQPNKDLLRDGSNPLGIIEELQGLGSCRVTVDASRVPPLESLDPEACYLGWEIVITTAQEEAAIRDPFMFVENDCKLQIERLDDTAPQPPRDGMGTDATPVDRPSALPPRIAEQLAAQASPTKQEAQDLRALRTTSTRLDASTSVRVAAEKLDQLVDLVGELVISQARLAQTANIRNDEELRAIAENLERLSSGLRDNTLDMRMIPIGSTFSRFTRLVRDLASELGKEIDLVTEGAETALDKTIIERIGDPLVHLVRNSCDHGVESPSEREAKGKPRRGTVRLSAYHTGDSVTIEVADDGAGLNTAVIRAKALERGLVSAESKLTESAVLNLIFLPGFSTAKAVSSISGRGVGMDVVKRSVEALRGSVDIESRLGQGTTIRLRLPLTLAIIEGLLVGVGESSYVMPLSMLEGCIELTGDDVTQAHGNNLVNVRGELVPYVRLRDWFGVTGARPPIEQVVIANTGGQRIGFVVDQVIGQHQTVLKSLGKMFKAVRELSGATILGDGQVALVLDVNTFSHCVQDVQSLLPGYQAAGEASADGEQRL